MTLLVALALAGCASSDDAGPAPVTTTAAAPVTTSAPATAAATTAPAPAASTAPSSDATATATIAIGAAPTTAAAVGAPAVFRFATADAVAGWRTQNDPVMGGVSTGELAWADGSLVFAGELSLDNGGGFASLVSPPIDPSPWAGTDGVRLDVLGDGRTYVLQVRADGAPGGWTQPFATSDGTGVSVTLRWADFAPVDRFLRPARATAPLDPATIRTLVIYLVEKREGPFRLAVQAIG